MVKSKWCCCVNEFDWVIAKLRDGGSEESVTDNAELQGAAGSRDQVCSRRLRKCDGAACAVAPSKFWLIVEGSD
jgi:hypothetical protein